MLTLNVVAVRVNYNDTSQRLYPQTQETISPLDTSTTLPSETLTDLPSIASMTVPSRSSILRPPSTRLPILRPPKSPAPKPKRSRFDTVDVQTPLRIQTAVPQLNWMFVVVMHDRPVPQSASASHAFSHKATSAWLSQMPVLVSTLVSQKQSVEQPPAPARSVPGLLHGGGL
jgi:hypothetical protein